MILENKIESDCKKRSICPDNKTYQENPHDKDLIDQDIELCSVREITKGHCILYNELPEVTEKMNTSKCPHIEYTRCKEMVHLYLLGEKSEEHEKIKETYKNLCSTQNYEKCPSFIKLQNSSTNLEAEVTK